VVTSLPASTSSADTQAGSDSPWVSRPTNKGPAIPWAVRYSTIACVVATMCASVNAPVRLEPRCPEVPKATRCAGSSRSGQLV
jgi:hypothetical protein